MDSLLLYTQGGNCNESNGKEDIGGSRADGDHDNGEPHGFAVVHKIMGVIL